MEVMLPHSFTPREYQKSFWKAMEGGIKRAVLVWHRRSGKDKTALNYMISQTQQRVGIYFYFLPTLKQGRKIIWDGIDRDSYRFIDHIPKELIKTKREDSMQIVFKNNSIFQVVGSDDYDKIIGTNAIGMVFSEFAVQDPRAWDHFRPIVRENGGWATFLSTPRGRNHMYELYEKVGRLPKTWYTELLTVEDTFRPDGTPVISQEDIEQDRLEGMTEEMIQQEYYCSFLRGVEGNYYSDVLDVLKEKNQITNVPYDASKGVFTFWDIGLRDATAIWFAQFVGQEIRLIDYYENTGFGIEHYLGILQDKAFKEKYIYMDHFAPHDMDSDEFGSGQSPKDIAKGLGFDFQVVERTRNINHGIQQVRSLLPKCWIDKTKCKRGLDCLKKYHKVWNPKTKSYADTPAKGWWRHGSDALRTMAEGFGKIRPGGRRTMTAEDCRELYAKYGPPTPD